MKILKEITPEVEKLFKDKNFASFATMMDDCSPQVTPVWVDYDNGNILINTAEGRAKVRNVSKNPKVAVSVTDSANPYTMVSVRGRIVEQTGRGACARSLRRPSLRRLDRGRRGFEIQPRGTAAARADSRPGA